MEEVSCIAKENGSISILRENKFTICTIYLGSRNILCGIIHSIQKTIIPVFPYLNTVLLFTDMPIIRF